MRIALLEPVKGIEDRGQLEGHGDVGRPQGPATAVQVAMTCLGQHSSLRCRGVYCDFEDGIVSLHGTLPSYYLKQLAQESVRGLDCVRQVRNHIQVGR